jgi:hypothetical protein
MSTVAACGAPAAADLQRVPVLVLAVLGYDGDKSANRTDEVADRGMATVPVYYFNQRYNTQYPVESQE